MFNRKDRPTAVTSARTVSRQLYLSGEAIDDTEVPDGRLGIALTTASARIVLIDEPEALRHLFGLLDALVLDGSEWRPRTIQPALVPPPVQLPVTPATVAHPSAV